MQAVPTCHCLTELTHEADSSLACDPLHHVTYVVVVVVPGAPLVLLVRLGVIRWRLELGIFYNGAVVVKPLVQIRITAHDVDRGA